MLKFPEVSVIIPVYNQAKFIDKAIESVLRQSYQDFEIIVINDGSTDNTESMVKGFIDFGIHYIYHSDNRSISAARNTGIRASRGKYIALLDADDEFLPEKLDMQVELLRNGSSDVGVVCAWSFNIDKNGNYISKRYLPRKGGYIFEDLLSANYMSVPALLIRRECFEKVGLFDNSLNGQEDWDMWIRIAKYYKFVLIKNPLAKYRLHPNQISKNLEAKIITAKRILVKYSDELQRRPYANSKHHFYIGNRLCHIGKTEIGKKFLLKSILLYPFNIRCHICFIGSLFGSKCFTYFVYIKRFFINVMIKYWKSSKSTLNYFFN